MLSQTLEYALRAMVHLAASPDGHAASSEAIAERTRVPRGYLSKVLRDLVEADLVVSRRGPHGGFELARAADAITIFDIVSAVDPIQRISRCPLGLPEHIGLCPLHKVLDDAAAHVEREYRRVTLRQLVGTLPDHTKCSLIAHGTAPAGRKLL